MSQTLILRRAIVRNVACVTSTSRGPMAINIARRTFIAAVGGAAFAWPLATRAQQPAEGIRRISVLMNTTSDDPEGRARVAAFAQALQKLGWIEGGNVRTDIRWAVD